MAGSKTAHKGFDDLSFEQSMPKFLQQIKSDIGQESKDAHTKNPLYMGDFSKENAEKYVMCLIIH